MTLLGELGKKSSKQMKYCNELFIWYFHVWGDLKILSDNEDSESKRAELVWMTQAGENELKHNREDEGCCMACCILFIFPRRIRRSC